MLLPTLLCAGALIQLKLPLDERGRPVLTHDDEAVVKAIEEAANATAIAKGGVIPALVSLLSPVGWATPAAMRAVWKLSRNTDCGRLI
eukprot:2219499-Prymnesium_polylepis.1